MELISKENRKIVFLVDDDAVFLKLMEIEFLRNTDYIIEIFSSGELALENLTHHPDVIVLDYHLNGITESAMNGIQTLDKIKAYDSNLPVVMLSSQDKIEVAVNCMVHNAFDYVVKSPTAFLRLRQIMTAITTYRRLEKELGWYMNRM